MSKFSVIVPTLNRPRLLQRALQAIAKQSHRDYEVLVIDDGSDADARRFEETLKRDFDDRFRWHFMPSREYRFSNAATVRNAGLNMATGDLIAFCDDDDEWTDEDYLATSDRLYTEHSDVDFIFSDQIGVQDGKTRVPTWLPSLRARLGKPWAMASNVFDVSLGALCKSWVPHLNTSSMRRSLIERDGRFWPFADIEEDTDFLLRVAAKARRIVYRDVVTATHYIPDRSKSDNLTTRTKKVDKYLFRMAIANHLRVATAARDVHEFARLYEKYACHELAGLLGNRDPRSGYEYSYKAFCLGPSLGTFSSVAKHFARSVKARIRKNSSALGD